MKGTFKVFSLILIIILIFSGCNGNNKSGGNTTTNPVINGGATLDEAVDWYARNKLAESGTGAYFIRSFKIFENMEINNLLTAYVLCSYQWLNADGEILSEGLDFSSVSFKRTDGNLIYRTHKIFETQNIAQSTEIPSSVKEKYADESIMNEIYAELATDIATNKASVLMSK